jgi:lipid-A-disaccharide synthase
MVNLVAGRTIVPELIQDRFTPDAVARETVSLLTDRGRIETMRRDLAEMRSRLGGPGASRRAAAVVRNVGVGIT